METTEEFKKFDDTKPQLSYLAPFIGQLHFVIKGILFGGKKYGFNNWKTCTDPRRFYDAMLRHANQSTYEVIDRESGLPHLALIIINALFIMQLRGITNENELPESPDI